MRLYNYEHEEADKSLQDTNKSFTKVPAPRNICRRKNFYEEKIYEVLGGSHIVVTAIVIILVV